jgi:hypothetical protein
MDLILGDKMRKIILICLLLFTPGISRGVGIIDYDFNSQSWGSLGHGSDWSFDATGGMSGTPAAKLSVHGVGVNGYWMWLNLSAYDSSEYWVEFDIRTEGNLLGGCKFVKFFGSSAEASQNNMSFWISANGSQQEVGYNKDALCVSRWNGTDSNGCPANHIVSTSSIDFRGGAWGHYKVWVKRAYPAGTWNGEVKVWFNGVLRAHITEMNSNPVGVTSTEFTKLNFGDYVGTGYTSPWYIWLDNIYVGTTEKTGPPVPDTTLNIYNPLPSATLPPGTTSTTLGVSTSIAATCRYSTASSTPYGSMTNFTTTGGTTHTKALTGLTDGYQQVYYVKCEDVGNDYPIVVSVAAAQKGLTVAKAGTGGGTVLSTPAGISCGTDCSNNFNQDSTVTLTALPADGSAFRAWSGCNSVSGNQCTVVLSTDKSVVASFSDYIGEIPLNLSTVNNLASGSDNWPITEDSAGVQWTSWGDGPGFQGAATPKASIGVAKVVGTKDSYTGTDTWHSGIDYSGWDGKSKGILAVGDVENGGTLYLWRSGTGSDVQGFALEQLYKSTDGGVTFGEAGGGTPVKWEPADFSPTSPRFANCTFVQFGGGYDVANIPDAVEGYAYLSCPEVQQPTVWNVQTPGQVTMMRVPIGSIEDKSTYQWYSGSGPTWSSDKADRVPIWDDSANGVMRISETYLAGIDRYILIGQQVDRFTASDAHIGIYESENPWGPWNTVTFENAQAFGITESGATKTVFWGISTKWSSGSDFTLVGTLPGQDEWGSVEGAFTLLNQTACDVDNYWACGDGDCQTEGFYYWEGACRTIEEPTDWTGLNLIPNGDFSAGLDEWGTYTPNNAEIAEGAAVLSSDVSTAAHIHQAIPSEGTFVVVANAREATNGVGMWTFDQGDVVSSVPSTGGTVRFTVSRSAGAPDNRFFVKSPNDVGISQLILDDVVVKSYLPTTEIIEFGIRASGASFHGASF